MRLFMTVAPIAEAVLRGEVRDGKILSDTVRRHGVSGIEIHLGVASRFRLADFVPDHMRKNVSFHSDHREFNLASANRYIREAAILQLTDEIRLADDLGATHLTFHPGRDSGHQTREQAMTVFWNSLRLVLDRIATSQTTLCVENMDNTPGKLCRTMDEVGATLDRFPTLSLTCDFAHLALNGIDTNAFVDRLEQRIKHIHASGVVDEKRHSATSLKESRVDLAPILRRFADRDIAVVIENKSSESLTESVDFVSSALALQMRQ